MFTDKRNPSCQGLIIVYTGGGKGKTTAALGLAIRSIVNGWNVCMIQFIKSSWRQGDIKIVKLLAPKFELITTGAGFVRILNDKVPLSEHRHAAIKALKISKEKITSGLYKIIILDEINYALSLKLIRLKDIMEIINVRPQHVTLVLTGDKANKRVIEKADIVTEMKCIKHHYTKGIKAIEGIDF